MRMTRNLLVIATLVLIGTTATTALADTVEALDPVYSGGEWQYYYILYTYGHPIWNGWWWEITDLGGITEVGTPASSDDWECKFTPNWVRWIYVGSYKDTGNYVFMTFDVTSTGPPHSDRPWDDASGESGTTTGPLPEPGTVGLLLLGLGVAGVGLRRRLRPAA